MILYKFIGFAKYKALGAYRDVLLSLGLNVMDNKMILKEAKEKCDKEGNYALYGVLVPVDSTQLRFNFTIDENSQTLHTVGYNLNNGDVFHTSTYSLKQHWEEYTTTERC